MSAPTLDEWLEELVDLQRDVEFEGYDDSVYGTCCVADPRDFDPDPECSTEEERARWKADCARVAKGLPRETSTACEHYSDPTGGISVRIQPSGCGLGVNTVKGDPQMAEVAERLQRLIGQITMWREERLTDEQRDS